MTGERSLQGGVGAVMRKAVMNSEKVCDSDRVSVLSLLLGASSDAGRHAPQRGEIVGILERLKDEKSANLSALEKEGLDRTTNHQDLMKVKTAEVSMLTKAIEETETLALKREQSAKEAAQRHQEAEAEEERTATERLSARDRLQPADSRRREVESRSPEKS